jgi:hypothetical protein
MLSLFYLNKMRKGIFTNKKVFLIGPAAYIKDMKYDDYFLTLVEKLKQQYPDYENTI